MGEGLLPEARRDSIREVMRTAARHVLNFRKETPLSDEQRQKLAAVLESHKAETQALIKQGREARRAYADAVKNHGPEASQTRDAAGKIGNLARDRGLLLARITSEARPLLTADQRKRLESAREEIESLVDGALAVAQ